MPTTAARGLRNRSILISGAGAAGQSLGYWLRRYGFEVTVIERAAAPRTGGFAVDLRGVAVTVADRMGILDACRAVRVRMHEIIRVDRHGDIAWRTDGNFGGGDGAFGDVEILRDDLTVILQAAVRDGVEYIFGDSIVSLAQDDDGVDVTFRHGTPRRFDLVIGADGLHSTVRALAFGPDRDYLRPLGYYSAIFTIPNFLNIDRQRFMNFLPGKLVSIINYGPDKHTRGLLVFTAPPLRYDRGDDAAQKALLEQAFAEDTTWEIPALLRELRAATDLYFDDVTQVRMANWSKGRVALLGDAGFAPTLITGQGTSLAVVGAYVLAGELKVAAGDQRVAFAQYEKALRAYVEQNQNIALDCPELAILDTWEEVEARERAFQVRAGQEDGAPDENSAAFIM